MLMNHSVYTQKRAFRTTSMWHGAFITRLSSGVHQSRNQYPGDKINTGGEAGGEVSLERIGEIESEKSME